MTDLSPGTPEPPRWLLDEMLGRLARYLRFFGHDAAYAQGGGDAAIAARARSERRVLVTRDRRLAASVEGALWIPETQLDDQLRALRRRFPHYPFRPTFERCSICNGQLRRVAPDRAGETDPPVPDGVRHSGAAIFACADCRHPYWEGSHTARVRAHVAEVLAAP